MTMDELNQALALALTGEAAAEAIAAMETHVATWGLSLPDTQPFVCDFGLGRFAEIGEVEVWIANEIEAGYCGKFLFVQDGQTCPKHFHETKHETFYLVKGRVRLGLEDEEHVLAEGAVLPVAPGQAHWFTGIGPALLLEISMPCLIHDNVFADPNIPIGRRNEG